MPQLLPHNREPLNSYPRANVASEQDLAFLNDITESLFSSRILHSAVYPTTLLTLRKRNLPGWLHHRFIGAMVHIIRKRLTRYAFSLLSTTTDDN
ncbi:unnamed protein product [Clonostachys byssicola]|uniref:Uncharacterized protein n=1 Tax=Clonostachys byssicola TaxID=160290 RepID=A0A9N9Y101_9HYPO|nr:unnamed protein product [Clonostachys byssicola]